MLFWNERSYISMCTLFHMPHGAREEAGSPVTRSATSDPITTLAFMRSGIRLASLVNHTQMLPWFIKIPWERHDD